MCFMVVGVLGPSSNHFQYLYLQKNDFSIHESRKFFINLDSQPHRPGTIDGPVARYCSVMHLRAIITTIFTIFLHSSAMKQKLTKLPVSPPLLSPIKHYSILTPPTRLRLATFYTGPAFTGTPSTLQVLPNHCYNY